MIKYDYVTCLRYDNDQYCLLFPIIFISEDSMLPYKLRQHEDDEDL